MAKKKSLKTALIMAILSITVCISMFAGTTFAWFTDSVTSSGNIIASGKLDVSMSWASGKADPDSATWNDASQTKIFNYDKWEPGYIDAKHIEISNDGTLAFKYKVDIVPNGEIGKLADVIDVYYADPAKAVTRENIESLDNIGTLSSVIANIGSEFSTASGNLPAGEKHVITLALRMKPTAGNEYQNLSVGNGFSVRLTATQLAYEEDSFDNQYDAGAELDFVMVSNANELKTALANKEENIILSKNITDFAETLTVDYNANINGGGSTISRAAGFTGTMINVANDKTLTVESVTLDGGRNEGVTATGNLIFTTNGHIVLG
ncbi:MAG: hypothetical protein J6C23_04150 [Clostridia bacterium]|nr:hypothetical protein [Clostridia bacterium]